MLVNLPLNKNLTTIRRALISVFDKTGIVDFAQSLHSLGVQIISTGGTAAALKSAQVPVTEVSDLTGFPEIMDGRVKTLHPRIEGGILGLRDKHQDDAKNNGIQWIDLVVCNLYPFAETIAGENVSLAVALENIDIGGPTMIRSAAKNSGWVGVVVDPEDYTSVLDEIRQQGGLTFETRRKMAAKAFGYTARYESLIHQYLQTESYPNVLNRTFEKVYDLRYGENPHQSAAVYREAGNAPPGLLNSTVIQGKQLSYNNLMDANAAWTCLQEFDEITCVVVKHANPCGVASGKTLLEAYRDAFEADRQSAFGGIIALNRPCSESVAKEIKRVFVEVVLAPSFDPGALEILAKKKNLRLIEMGDVKPLKPETVLRQITGGVLVQDKDNHRLTKTMLKTVTRKHPSATDIHSLLFAWKVLKHVKSNGIVIARGNRTTGIGAGQPSRVGAVEIALKKAAQLTEGAVLASDAFFPFRDNIDLLANTGIRAIIQPGGSIRDGDIIEACDELGIAMVFTGIRCFKH